MDDETNKFLSEEITKDLFSNDNYNKIDSIPKNMNVSYGQEILKTENNSSNDTLITNFYNISITKWLIIFVAFIFLFAFIGFNILIFLGKSVNEVIDIFKPYLGNFSGFFKKSIGEISTNTTKGLETTANVASGIVVGAVSGAETGYEISKEENIQESQYLNNDITKTLENNNKENSSYIADDSYSSIQMKKTNAKSGFCYIGEERGIRSCVEVGVNDVCMSGDIFPTKDICINPNLRV